MKAAEVGLRVHPGADVYTLPCIAGHVGADTAGVLLSEAPHESDEVVLVVDVGTNAEIVLGNRERLLACSSPTGPAFEGAQVSSGQRAALGAIERVRIDPETLAPRFRIIGSDLWSDEKGFDEVIAEIGVTGVCGSGIIEAVAEMYLAGLVTPSGLVAGARATDTPHLVRRGEVYDYLLHKGPPEIYVIQTDVRSIQLAKAALYAGARLLMDRFGVSSVVANRARRRVRQLYGSPARHDPRYDSGLRPHQGRRRRKRRRGRRPHRALEPANTNRDRGPGRHSREGRDGGREAFPRVLCRRHGHPATATTPSPTSIARSPAPSRLGSATPIAFPTGLNRRPAPRADPTRRCDRSGPSAEEGVHVELGLGRRVGIFAAHRTRPPREAGALVA